MPDAWFINSLRTDFLEDFRTAPSKDRIVNDALTALRYPDRPRTASLDLADWKLVDGLVLYQHRIYVPPPDALRRDLVKLHHDAIGAGHPGASKTYDSLKREFWWPGMYRFVLQYVAGCAICQQMKSSRVPRNHPLRHLCPPPRARRLCVSA